MFGIFKNFGSFEPIDHDADAEKIVIEANKYFVQNRMELAGETFLEAYKTFKKNSNMYEQSKCLEKASECFEQIDLNRTIQILKKKFELHQEKMDMEKVLYNFKKNCWIV